MPRFLGMGDRLWKDVEDNWKHHWFMIAPWLQLHNFYSTWLYLKDNLRWNCREELWKVVFIWFSHSPSVDVKHVAGSISCLRMRHSWPQQRFTSLVLDSLAALFMIWTWNRFRKEDMECIWSFLRPKIVALSASHWKCIQCMGINPSHLGKG